MRCDKSAPTPNPARWGSSLVSQGGAAVVASSRAAVAE